MFKVIKLKTVTSTNDYIMSYENKIDKLVVVSDEQTAGKGRRGKSFISLKNKGLFFSILFLNRFSVSDLNKLTVIATLSVVHALKQFGVNAHIKWLNDIYLDYKKLGGVLVETKINDNNFDEVIIGIGINFKTVDKDFASLENFNHITRELLFDEILIKIDELILKSDNELYNEYVNYLITNRLIDIKELNEFDVSIIGLDTNYNLIVKTNLGEEIVLDSTSISLELK